MTDYYYIPGARVTDEFGSAADVSYVMVDQGFVLGEGVGAATYSAGSLRHPAVRALVGAVLQPAYDPATHHPPARDAAGWGVPVAKTAADLADEQAAALESARALRRAAVDQAVVEKLQAGYPDPGTGLHVDIHPDGRRADMAGLVSAALIAASGAAAWSAAYSQGWIAKENTRIPLPTPEAGIALAAAAGDWYARIRQRGRDLKDAINAAADPATVDIAAGWPA